MIVTLTLLSETSSAALASLNTPISPQKVPVPLPILHTDLLSLLSLIHSSSTKSALTLNPSGSSYPAALPPLTALSTHTAALAHCARLFAADPAAYGHTLAREVSATARDVVEAVRALAQTLLALHVQAHAGQGTGQAGEEYIVRTAGVHDLIDKAKGPNGLSKDNLGAVRKMWAQDRGALEDGFREVGEMVEDAEEEGGDEEEEQAEDGWDELGLGKSVKMDPAELARTKSVHALLRLTTLLHKRVLLDLLSPSPPSSRSASHPTIQTLDALPLYSTALLTASDDLVATLYTPQDPVSVRMELIAFADAVRALQSGMQAAFFPLDAQLAGMRIADAKDIGEKKVKDPRKWFETCFEQIYKSAGAFVETLSPAADNINICGDTP